MDELKQKKQYSSVDKQAEIIAAVSNGTYRVEIHTGTIYKKGLNGHEKVFNGYTDKKTGHVTYSLRDKGKLIRSTGQVIVWLAGNGEFEPGKKIVHIDRNPGNNCIQNLKMRNMGQRKKRRSEDIPADARKFKKMCRFAEIVRIKKILEVHPGKSAIEISEDMRCNYNSVLHVVRCIRNGKPLKFEKRGPYKSPNRGKRRAVKKIDIQDWMIGN